MIWFTADLHLEHARIIEYCKRPFRNVQQMNNVLIKNYNNTVGDDDTVYIVGDFSIKSPSYKRALQNYVEKLKGRKHLILGNHDQLGPFDYTDIGFMSVHTRLDVEEFVLAHDPAQAYTTNKVLLHGHIHQLWQKHENEAGILINVGVDVWDFKPVSIDEVRDLAIPEECRFI